MANNVKFMYGPKASYTALATKDNNTLYFLTDTLQIFKGTEEYTKSCKLVTSLPSSGQVQGTVYVRTTDFTLHIYNGVEFVQITKQAVTAISGAGDDATLPTTKAVADYVTSKIAEVTGANDLYVREVTYNAGVLSVDKGNGAVTTTMTGVAHEPTYEASTRTITIPMFGKDALVINLGKDAVVSSGHYDADKKTIELTLTSGDPVSIPVGSLIDIYTGIATSTATVSVSADNKISVAVKVSAKANNSIVIEEDGLYVAVPDAYTKAETDAKVKAVADTLTDHAADSVAHITAEERTEWNAKATTQNVADAKSQAIAAAAEDATKKANDALDSAKTYADSLDNAMDVRVSAVEDLLVWKTIA